MNILGGYYFHTKSRPQVNFPCRDVSLLMRWLKAPASWYIPVSYIIKDVLKWSCSSSAFLKNAFHKRDLNLKTWLVKWQYVNSIFSFSLNITKAECREMCLTACHFYRKNNLNTRFDTFKLSVISRESIVFVSNFRNKDFDGYTRFEVPWIRKSHF